MKYPKAEDNVANFGEVNYKVEPVLIYTGWITEIIETPGEETIYRVIYEDSEEADLTLSQLNNHQVSTNKTSLEKRTETSYNRRPRRKACEECDNCKKEDCGTCRQCKDKPKFGGRNVLRERCKERRCIELGGELKNR